MLLASTQVELPGSGDGDTGQDLARISEVVSALDEPVSPDADEFGSNGRQESPGTLSSRPKKSRGLSLDLLQFRR